ncbi:MAG TPA: DUF4124 domain-containing protein [Candidatus Manganitrophaceae bacterium]|nr:DUF4124 domain-containing protein [Candidatus Manganitrophaceae bacterium]
MNWNDSKKVFGVAMLLTVLLCEAQLPALGQVYQWEDERGTVHLTDNPQTIPEKYRERAKEIILPKEKEGSAPPGGPEESAPFIPSEKVDNQGHNREWWQGLMKEWREKKVKAEEKLADANGRLGRLQMVYPSLAQQREETAVREEIRQRQEELREAERMLDEQLPEEARKAEAPPGWLRE